MTEEELKSIRLHLSLLFSSWSDYDPPRELGYASEYLEFISANLVWNGDSFPIPLDLITQFESVFLLVSERLSVYPEAIQKQVRDIVESNNLCERFAIYAAFTDPETTKHLRFRSRLRQITNTLISLIGRTPEKDPFGNFSVEELVSVRIALSRLAQILKYASNMKVPGSDVDYSDASENYDFSRINKYKVISILNVLKAEIDRIPDDTIKGKLIERINCVEEELNRQSSIRWTLIITSLFILVGFLADLKTLHPDIYSSAHGVAQHVVTYIYSEGQVHSVNGLPPLLGVTSSSERKDESPHIHISPAILPKRDNETMSDAQSSDDSF